jgi:BirA family transcriptional regulator, biotin operon repressor / biotin---[acetyl-CoA-carboxylase] ligase
MRTKDSIMSTSRSTSTNQSAHDRLILAELSASLGKNIIGQRILVLESTGSTNDFLLQMLTPELPEGFVVFAEHQRAGRGQRGHHWESASHLGLWFSVLLRPRLPRTESARLTTWAAQAIAAIIRTETGLEPAIKPPNDVYLAERKVAGVLVETKAGAGDEFAAIAGLGVNINQRREDFPIELRERAGSLAMSLGRRIDRTAFAVALLHELEETRESALAASTASPTLSS